MGDRTFVVIFFFWAALTIVTPMLVLLSESYKQSLLLSNGDAVRIAEVVKPRKMMGYDHEEAEKKWNSTASENVSAVPSEAPLPSFEEADDGDYHPPRSEELAPASERLADE
ncbi:unnamed protein product [Linum tenue]|uniref:Uncharacterized protein n=1 Tax=Linum tenue TaxID=586396 RepID=A0AAV0LNN1_9ROSI|nr:unnamed protein product [Linum tenue]